MFTRQLLSGTRSSRALLLRSFATEVQPPPTASSSSSSPSTSTPHPNLHTAIILNRSPLITRTPTPFEKAFHAYQARIHRALHNPFPTDFYFKQGSPLETRFNIEERRRERRTFGAPFGTDKTGESSEATELMEMAMRDEVDESAPRVHTADEANDLKSLDRRGQRNLYLLLKTNENGKDLWRFPQGNVQKGEFLHVAAHRRLDSECGRCMDTWIVSRNPIGVYHPPKPATPVENAEDDVVFFYKAHILAGQVQPDSKQYPDFAWLTKGEISKRTDEHYWMGIKDMLSDF